MIKHYDNFDLHWKVSSDGGATWIDGGTSSNDLYLTLADPEVSPLYHTVVHIGSHYAAGNTTEDDTITDVWCYFGGLQVQNVDGDPLHYYKDYRIGNVATEGLLEDKDGQCASWADLFLNVLRAQGIDRDNNYVYADSTAASNASGFLVDDWQFAAGGGTAAAAPPTAPDDLVAEFPYLNLARKDAAGNYYIINAAGNGYTWLGTPHVTDQAGIDGQNNANPASIFNNHQFVQLNVENEVKWFDPSYGVEYTGATQTDRILDFEDSLAGYCWLEYADVQENVVGLDLDGDGDTNGIVN